MEPRHEEASGPDELDLWLADVGEDYVVRLVQATKRGIAEGAIPTFTDKDHFLQYLTPAKFDKPA
jgi:hypothetical protein